VVDGDKVEYFEEDGRIVERGRHDELLTAGGLYSAMWALQKQDSGDGHDH